MALAIKKYYVIYKHKLLERVKLYYFELIYKFIIPY